MAAAPGGRYVVKKPSYRTLAARNRTQADRIDELIEQRDDAVNGEQACAS